MKRHVQLPNNMTENLKPTDLLIYLDIKRNMNNETKESFPSLETISKRTGASIPTIRKCINNLEEAGYIEIRKEGRKNIYKFLKYKEFEPFSYEFLDNQNLSFTEKAYIAASQQYMFKEDGFGKTTFTNKELAKRINMSESSVSRCNKSLEKKDYLSIMETDVKDLETGLRIKEKIFYLNELGQAVIFALKNHEDRINSHEDKLNEITQRLSQLELENKVLKQKLANTPTITV
jgi:DNA-binding MarR family transcriptional regulator